MGRYSTHLFLFTNDIEKLRKPIPTTKPAQEDFTGGPAVGAETPNKSRTRPDEDKS